MESFWWVWKSYQGLAGRACKFIRKETPTQCFPVNFAKFLKTRFLFNISGRRLLFDPVSAFRIRIFPRSFRYKILLFDVENSNVEIHNVVSTLIWCCPTSRRRINQKTTLKQRWNVTPKVTWHFNIIITWQKRYLFTFTRNMDPTLSSVVTKDYKSKKLYLLEGYWFFYGYYDRGLCRFG